MFNSKLSRPIFTRLPALIAVGMLLFSTQNILAHRNPSNCGGAGVGVQVFKFRQNGSVANTIQNGEKVVYVIQIQNNSQLQTPSGLVPVCDVTCANVLFYCPDSAGSPGSAIVIATNVNLPFGTPPFVAGSITCLVSVASSVANAKARAEVQGVVHDLSIAGCTPDATCVRNNCDPDIGGGQQQVSVSVRNPCINVFKQCGEATNIGGSSVRISFLGSVTNCGDETLVNVSVINDQPVPGTVVTNISSIAAGQSVSFSGSYTNSRNICGPFPDTVTATGAGISSLAAVSATNSAVCTITSRPCIAVTKTNAPANCNQSINFGGAVRNCGNVILTNISVVDSISGVVKLIPSLAPGASSPYTGSHPSVPGTNTDTVTAIGADICTGATVTNRATASTVVICPPCISATKLIACLVDSNTCGAFDKSATGFKVITGAATNLPAFCYSITISNCGQIALTNVSVIDDKFGDMTANFFTGPSDIFAVGTGRGPYIFKTSLEFDLTNTVNASGRSVANGQTVFAHDSATGHVFEASIACNKIVTSPDDRDGNTNDDHVLFQCGSGPHLIAYSVVVTNMGDADLTNIVITDPTLAAICTLPGPFSLAAGAFTNITLCGHIPFECGTGGGSTNSNNCANPMLGSAAGCTVLELGGGQVAINGPPGGIQGDVCIGPNGKLAITGGEYVTGNIKLSPGATYQKSGPGTIGGTVQHNVNLSSQINAALATASSAASMPCTQTFSSLALNNHATNTIIGNAGLNVICVHDVVLNTAVIRLSGPAGATFIMNVSGKFVLNGTSHILAADGVQAKDILYNIIGTGQDVAFTGGGGGVGCCNSSVDGTLLVPQRNINLSPGLVNGQVIGGRNISIVSGSSVRCPPPPCTPVTVVNTITINADVSALQSNTNIIHACVRNIHGQVITTSSQCSATVECR